MKINKDKLNKIFARIGFAFLWLFVIFIIFTGYLFLFPSKSIFSIHYVDYDSKCTNNYYITENVVSDVFINCESYDFNVNFSNKKEVKSTIISNTNGLALTTKNVGTEIVEKDKKIYINISQIKGLLFINENRVEITIPKSIIDEKTNIEINSKKSDIKIDGNIKNLKINSLLINNEKGKVEVDDVDIQNLNVKTNNGYIYLGENTVIHNNVKLNVGSGKVYLNEVNNLIQNVKIDRLSGGKIFLNKALNFEYCYDGSGKVFADSLTNSKISTRRTDFEIRSAIDVFNYSSSGNSNLSIDNLLCKSSISANSGEIYVKNVISDVKLYSKRANLVLKNIDGDVNIEAVSCNIDLQFKEDVKNNLKLSLKSGNLNVSGVSTTELNLGSKVITI